MNTPKPFIAIAGLIGAGKTTLANALSKEFGVPLFKEPVEKNPILPLFYENQEKYSFILQVYLLNKRVQQQKEIIYSYKGGIMDRSIYEDYIFSTVLYNDGKMSKIEYDTILETFQDRFYDIIHPNCIIYLRISPQTALDRIRKRARKMEVSISIEYLTALFSIYEWYIKELSKNIHVIYVNWEDPHINAEKLTMEIKRCIEERKITSYV